MESGTRWKEDAADLVGNYTTLTKTQDESMLQGSEMTDVTIEQRVGLIYATF